MIDTELPGVGIGNASVENELLARAALYALKLCDADELVGGQVEDLDNEIEGRSGDGPRAGQ